MSRSYEYSYELQRAARQAVFNARVRETTERFYQRYLEQFQQMQQQGYEAYIPDEMQRLQNDLSLIRHLLVTDPAEAREISFTVGSYIRSLWPLGRSAAAEFAFAERQRTEARRLEKQQTQNALMNEYYRYIGAIPPAVVHFAQNDLLALRQKLESGAGGSVSELQHQISEITQQAEQKAADWKRQKIQSHKKADLASRLEEVQASVQQEKIEDQQAAKEFLARLESLQNDLVGGTCSVEAAEQEISQIETQVDDVLITEEVRRQTVRSIVKQLRSQDFMVSAPTVIKNDSGSFVCITAKKPSGKRAECQIDLKGKIRYKFDKYEGMTCLKDIERFNVDLDKIYSVKLSDERVLWSNPDRLSKDADQMPTGSTERRHL